MPLSPVLFLISDRTSVVVRAEDYAAGPIGMPGDYHVCHFHRLRLTLLPGRESLELHLRSEGLEMFLHKLLLLGHSVGSADARPDLTDGNQVAHRLLAVEGDG